MSLLTRVNPPDLAVPDSATIGIAPGAAACVHTAFEEHAARFPRAVAVIFEGREVTYGDLNASANRIAHGLRAAGDEILVAVYLDRSIEMVAAMLGVLKAGAAYLPIDPALPVERVQFMIEDASAAMVITDRKLAANLKPGGAVIGLVDDLLREQSARNPNLDMTPDRLACVICTSGSTGQPKGVEVRHEGMLGALRGVQTDLDFTAVETVLAATSQAFDVSGLELFLPLTCGATVVLLPQGHAAQSDRMIAAIKEHDPTLLCGTPSVWRLLVHARWEGSARLRAISGGEPLDAGLASFLMARTRGVWNQYGPTETSIVATSYRVRPGDQTIPIGKALPHARAFVLDDQGQIAAPGAAGELCLGGPCVARGYRNRAQLTADKFIRLLLPDGRVERVYRTGDVVRQLADGNFTFLHRLDTQVKVRGYRIELEEIEAKLREHPGIDQAAVIVYGSTPDEKTLAAYYVEADTGGDVPTAEQLRAFLGQRLPAYMVPSHFARLARLPLTTNGKTDRAKLALRKLAVAADAPIDDAFGTDTEKELLKIWRRLLNRTAIAKQDKFFDIGGHSLMAASLFAEIGKRFDVHLPLSTFTSAPTIESLARMIEQRESIPAWSPLVPIQETGERPPFFCVHGIYGNVLSFQNVSKHLGPWQPFYAFQARGLDGKEAAHTSIEAMAADYLDLAQRVQPAGPYLLGGFSAGGFVALEMARMLRQQGQQVALLAMIDGYLDAEKKPEPLLKQLGNLWRWTVKGIRARVAFFRTLGAEDRNDAFSQDWQRAKAMVTIARRKLAGRTGRSTGTITPYTAFLEAVRGYIPKPLDCRAVLFQSTLPVRPDLTARWRQVLTGPLEIRHIEGHHSDLVKEPMVLGLATELDQDIEAALDELV